jgi:hypothetical protein
MSYFLQRDRTQENSTGIEATSLKHSLYKLVFRPAILLLIVCNGSPACISFNVSL